MPKDKPPRRTRTNSTFKVPDAETLARKRTLARTESRQRLVRRKKKARKPRPESETERAHGPAEYREWMKGQKCIVRSCTARPCDSAHIHSGGKGRKDDWTRTAPLCATQVYFSYVGHHEQYDNAKQSFPLAHGLDMEAEAAANQVRWQAYLNQRNVG